MSSADARSTFDIPMIASPLWETRSCGGEGAEELVTHLSHCALFTFRLFVSDGVTVTTDTGVLVSLTVALARSLALKHLRVLRDAVAVTLGNLVFGGLRLVASGSPGEVVTTDLNVVVGEFTELVIIHTEKFGLLRSTKVESRDLVDDESDCSTDDERVCGDGGDVSDLHVHLLPVVLNPSTIDVVNTVKTNDVRGSENAVEEETNHASNTVLSEHIHSIINTNPELDLGCKVAHDTSDDTKNDGCPRSDETGSGSSSDKARDGTGTPTDHRPLTSELEFQQAMVARRLAPKAEPPLKPSQPNQRKTVPRVMRETLCGRKLSIIFSWRLPRIIETPHLKAHPLAPQTQHAMGQRPRSATAPTTIAPVTAQNCSCDLVRH
ncbi:ammonium transporter, partial [Aureobasidium melanogenum]